MKNTMRREAAEPLAYEFLVQDDEERQDYLTGWLILSTLLQAMIPE
ncbi:MAG: hypothetical protein GTO29_13555 [Candidatus Latescibacteria bacterium]|nr:hypothetical protein [Candidatus Latescibacterota bacterium]NIO57278.1 hypothetical protein [Candidatus Latescibacterota bacterium]